MEEAPESMQEEHAVPVSTDTTEIMEEEGEEKIPKEPYFPPPGLYDGIASDSEEEEEEYVPVEMASESELEMLNRGEQVRYLAFQKAEEGKLKANALWSSEASEADPEFSLFRMSLMTKSS